MNKRIINICYLTTSQLILLELLLILTQILFSFKTQNHLNLNLYSLLISPAFYYFASKKRNRPLPITILILSSILFILNLLITKISQFTPALLFNITASVAILITPTQKNFTTETETKNIFHILLITYLILILTNEYIKITFININHLLLPTLIMGILTLFTEKKEQKTQTIKKNTLIPILTGLICGTLIFIKTRQLKEISYLISLTSTLAIILLGFLLTKENEKNTN